MLTERPLSFGIMSTPMDRRGRRRQEPQLRRVDVIEQLSQQFIKAGVKLVVAVGMYPGWLDRGTG